MKVRLLLISCFIFIISLNAFAQQASLIDVQVDASSGKYTLTSQALHWSFSGTVGQPLAELHTTKGKDEAGNYKSIRFTWNNGLYA